MLDDITLVRVNWLLDLRSRTGEKVFLVGIHLGPRGGLGASPTLFHPYGGSLINEFTPALKKKKKKKKFAFVVRK